MGRGTKAMGEKRKSPWRGAASFECQPDPGKKRKKPTLY